MTNEELDAIEAAAKDAGDEPLFAGYAREEAIPALIAEVRRLRAELDDQAVERMGEDA